MINKQIRFIIIGACAVVLLVAAFFLVKLLPNKDTSSSFSSPSYPVGITGYDSNSARDDIDVMTTTNPNRTLHFHPLKDGEYVKSQKWTIDEFGGQQSSDFGVNDLALSFYSITATNELENVPTSDLGKYGLDKPNSTISIKFLDGKIFTYSFGNKTPLTDENGGGYYMMRNGDPTVYVVESYYYQELQQGLPNLIGYYMTDKLENLESFTEIKLTGKGYPEQMDIKLIPTAQRNTETDSKFQFVQPLTRDIDTNNLVAITDSLDYLDADSIAAAYDKAIPADVLKQYGFNSPEESITYTYAGKTNTLTVGSVQNGNAYVMINNYPVIYTLTYSKVSPWCEANVDKLAVRTIYLRNINQITDLKFETSFKTFDFKISSLDGSASGATLNGNRLVMSDFRNFFATFAGITYIERTTLTPPKGATPYIDLTVKLNDGATEHVQFIQYTPRRYFAIVNGQGGVLVSYEDVNTLVDNLKTLDKSASQ